MKAILIDNKIQYFQNFKTFGNTINVQSASEQQIYDWGFRDVIILTVLETQKLGEMYFDIPNDVWTYYIIDKTQTEINAELIAKTKDEFKNNLTGVFAYAWTPDGTKEYAIKIGNDGKIVTVLIP